MRTRHVLLAMVVICIFTFPAFAAINLTMGKAHGNPGDTVTIPLLLSFAGEAPVGLSSNSTNGGFITFDPSLLTFVGAEKGPALKGADITMAFTEASPGKVTFQIMDSKLQPLSGGEIVLLKFTIAKGAKCNASAPVGLNANVACSDAETHILAITVGDGAVEVKCGPQEKKTTPVK
jgi:hypothetical protein